MENIKQEYIDQIVCKFKEHKADLHSVADYEISRILKECPNSSNLVEIVKVLRNSIKNS